MGSDTTNTNTVSSVPAPDTSGLLQVDAMIKKFTDFIAATQKSARDSLLQSKKSNKIQNRQNHQELEFYKSQLAALNVQPAPEVKGLGSAEVMQARRQVSLDAAGNNGMRQSILTAGAPGMAGQTFSGSGAPRIAPAAAPRSILSPTPSPAAVPPPGKSTAKDASKDTKTTPATADTKGSSKPAKAGNKSAARGGTQ